MLLFNCVMEGKLELEQMVETRKLTCLLQNFMDDRNLNITQLARETAITPASIRGYAQNTFKRIDSESILKLCLYFGVGMGDMFSIQEVK